MATTFDSGVGYVSDPIAESQERTRARLAMVVMAILLAVTALIVAYIFKHSGNDSAKLMITGLFTPIIGIVGTVLGFYFASPKE